MKVLVKKSFAGYLPGGGSISAAEGDVLDLDDLGDFVEAGFLEIVEEEKEPKKPTGKTAKKKS